MLANAHTLIFILVYLHILNLQLSFQYIYEPLLIRASVGHAELLLVIFHEGGLKAATNSGHYWRVIET